MAIRKCKLCLPQMLNFSEPLLFPLLDTGPAKGKWWRTASNPEELRNLHHKRVATLSLTQTSEHAIRS